MTSIVLNNNGGIKIKLNYLTAGDSSHSALIFVHELGGNITTWDFVINDLAQYFYVIALDLPDSGNSDLMVGQYEMSALIDILECFIKTLAIDSYVLIGLALGGITALHSALTYVDKIKGLVVLDAIGDLRDETRNYVINRGITARDNGMESVVNISVERSFYELHNSRLASVRRNYIDRFVKNNPRGYWRLSQLLGTTPNIGKRIKEIKIPCFIGVGENDVIFTPSECSDLAKNLPNGYFHIIPNAAHFPPLQNPEGFTSKVIPFLRMIAGHDQ
ncbi:MAG: alpha/beta hydrolase [Candidatus Cloacimonetes bacterium]|nr:alpha/beta hydrolase [Candidatus Cloacimonadota bacterium]